MIKHTLPCLCLSSVSSLQKTSVMMEVCNVRTVSHTAGGATEERVQTSVHLPPGGSPTGTHMLQNTDGCFHQAQRITDGSQHREDQLSRAAFVRPRRRSVFITSPLRVCVDVTDYVACKGIVCGQANAVQSVLCLTSCGLTVAVCLQVFMTNCCSNRSSAARCRPRRFRGAAVSEDDVHVYRYTSQYYCTTHHSITASHIMALVEEDPDHTAFSFTALCSVINV